MRQESREMTNLVIHADPEIMSGEPVFVGTRVPVKICLTASQRATTSTSFWTPIPASRRSRRSRPWTWDGKRSKRLRILIHESLPRELAGDLIGHNATTVRDQQWTGLRNGVLLRAAVAARLHNRWSFRIRRRLRGILGT